MARKHIPTKDKEIIKHRLAQGMSYRQAIEGTVVSSTSTVSAIATQESNEIEQIREEYIAMINIFGADDVERAKLWAEMTKATKSMSVEVTLKKGKTVKDGVIYETIKKTEVQKEIPDWQVREKALSHIDEVVGICSNSGKVNVNVSTNPAPQISGEERKSLNEKFERFLLAETAK